MKQQYLLDSNVLIDYLKKRSPAVTLIRNLRANGTLSMSSLSIMELQAGWTDHQAEKFFPLLFSFIKVYKITEDILYLTGKLRRDYRKKGIILQPLDTIIAATALDHTCTLVTYNARHFKPIKELQLYLDK